MNQFSTSRVLRTAALLLATISFACEAKLTKVLEDKEAIIPKSDWDCKFQFGREGGCYPSQYCSYQYHFLDATPSESCRLKKRIHREVFFEDGLQVAPAAALAGAAALFAADLGAVTLTPALDRFPVLFNLVQGFVLLVAGDTLFQVLEQGKRDKIGLRIVRMLRSGLIGAFNNGFMHFQYYKWIDRVFPYHKLDKKWFGEPGSRWYEVSVGFVKWAIEYPTIGAYKIASMYAFVALMEGNLGGLAEKFRKRFGLTMLRALQVWPIYDTLLYAFVDVNRRPLLNTFMSILWGGYLSSIAQDEGALGGDEE